MKQWMMPSAVAMLTACAVACGGDDDEPNNNNDNDTTSSSSSGQATSSGEPGSSSGENPSSSSGATPEPCAEIEFQAPADNSAPLAVADYEDYFSLSADFPFEVVGLYTLPGAAPTLAAEDGRLLAFENSFDGSGDVVVHQLTAPSGASGALTSEPLTLAGQMPFTSGMTFFNYPPVASLPNNRWLLSYTGTAVDGSVPGRAYLFEGSTLLGNAWANGIYSPSTSLTANGATHLFYHAFSPLAESQDLNVSESAVYALAVDGGLSGQSRKVFETGTDASGPVLKDAVGDLFAVTSSLDGANLWGQSRCGALEGASVSQALTSFDAAGSSTVAALPPIGAQPGYLLNADYNKTVVTIPFTKQAGSLTVAAEIEDAIVVDDEYDVNVIGDRQGYLWLSLSGGDADRVAKLRRKAQ